MENNKEEIVVETTENIEKIEELEEQTTFNNDGFDMLCTEDTIIENIEEVE